MSRIIDVVNREVIKKTVLRCRERKIIIPTFEQLRNPDQVPETVLARLPGIGSQDVDPHNLFRITWKNDSDTGLYGTVNCIEIPREITGVRAHIIGLAGGAFPTGAHKVGAAFGCLVPRLVSGEFDPEKHKAVWPSTGNFCRGGAFDCALLGCAAVAVLPEEMSQERFDWLESIGVEVIATPGCESNVKEIYDKCWELKEDPANVVFNQFEEFGNAIFHYAVTGPAIEEAMFELGQRDHRFAAFVSATGSGGTIAAGDYLKQEYPRAKVVAAEALQCPTLSMNGFGGHRIEGIGDKHVPWIHNVRNTDGVAAIDDADCMALMRLFNEASGMEYLRTLGVEEKTLEALPQLGISSICNLLASIKAAKYFEMDGEDVIFTVFTDSMEMYGSRLSEATESDGDYETAQAAFDYGRSLAGQGIDHFKELSYYDRKAIHNLKYFTWVEQQGRSVEELEALWEPAFWRELFEEEVDEFDRLIDEFNREVASG